MNWAAARSDTRILIVVNRSTARERGTSGDRNGHHAGYRIWWGIPIHRLFGHLIRYLNFSAVVALVFPGNFNHGRELDHEMGGVQGLRGGDRVVRAIPRIGIEQSPGAGRAERYRASSLTIGQLHHVLTDSLRPITIAGRDDCRTRGNRTGPAAGQGKTGRVFQDKMSLDFATAAQRLY